jgi:alkylated DNA repair dioxygenase AlkB
MNGELFVTTRSLEAVAMKDAEVWFLRELDLGHSADAVLARLREEVEWRTETVRMWDKVVLQPRLVAWYGDEGACYEYSGRRFDPLPWTPLLKGLRERVETACGGGFNSGLRNL